MKFKKNINYRFKCYSEFKIYFKFKNHSFCRRCKCTYVVKAYIIDYLF